MKAQTFMVVETQDFIRRHFGERFSDKIRSQTTSKVGETMGGEGESRERDSRERERDRQIYIQTDSERDRDHLKSFT